MADIFTKEKRSEIMSRIKGKNTAIELLFRKALWRMGLRGWRVHSGKHRIDVAFTRKRIAIFIDGCFWHGCPKHYKKPKTGKGYWIPKIRANRKRDKKTTKALEMEGWVVIRIWEHDLSATKITNQMEIIREALI